MGKMLAPQQLFENLCILFSTILFFRIFSNFIASKKYKN